MGHILNYNIHDALKFKIVRDKTHELFDSINLKFSFFEVDKVSEPDITLNIGKFTPSNEDCYVVDNKYHVKENYFYCKDSEGKAKWEVEIFGFEKGNTIINYHGQIFGLQSLINPDFIAQNFLLKMIEYKLGIRDYFTLHSGAISKGDKGYLLVGRGGSLKTTLIMDLVREFNFSFMSDDRAILHKDKIYSFPMSLNVFKYMMDYLPTENIGFYDKLRCMQYIYRKEYEKSFLSIDNLSKLEAMFFITKTNKQGVSVNTIEDKRDVVDRLIANNQIEDFVMLNGFGINSGPFLKYVMAYSFIFHNNKVISQIDQQEKNLEKILENIPVCEVEIPLKYDKDVLNHVYDVIRNNES
jgi:hypothetical protein